VEYLIKDKKCIIQCAGPGHEVMGNIFMQFWHSQGSSTAHNDLVRKVDTTGSAEIDLQDGARKLPDFSFCDRDSRLSSEERSFPTTIWEVAYTEATSKLAVDCARFIACSLGRELLAIGVDIKHSEERGIRKLASVKCSTWELDHIERISHWPPRAGDKLFGRDLDTLYRSDRHATAEARDLVCPPATSFFCISEVGDQGTRAFFAFHAKETQAFNASYCTLNS
jgi:hypothetical protein